ncbi:MAG: RagB/SusD family nutrient uptake outer membrane protein [Dysgonamonadaceae bacterium]|jgi:hypothetical protein|nr:RagB/SusD family nutrient uptake outer membrane protein [Dysgonamonadaceae bacterium]
MKKLIICVISGIMMINLTSCEPEMDYLNPDSDVIQSYYNTQEHLIYAVNGIYGILQGLNMWGRDMPYILNTRSDEGIFTFKASAGDITVVQLANYTNGAEHAAAGSAFGDFYTIQYTANLALEKLQENQGNAFDLNKPQDKVLYDRLMGEAYFLRGFSRFYLTFFWGDELPDRDYTATSADFYAIPAEKGVIYQKMVEDFKKAEELLPVRSVIYADQSNTGRATKGAAQAMLAKAYMGRPILDGSAGAGSAEWSKAKDVLWEIIKSDEYELVNNYRDNASEDNENSKESLFEIQFTRSADALYNVPIDIVGGGQNTWRQVCMTIPDPIGWWNLMPSLSVYNEFERDVSGNIIDARAFQGLWIPNGAKFRKSGIWVDYNQLIATEGDDRITWRGKYLGTRKYGTDYDGYDMMRGGANDRIIRYSDVLLMYAECCLETNDEPTALYYINMVRSRANNQMNNPSEADVHMFYATGQGTLPAAEDIIAAAPVLGQVKDDSDNVIIPGFAINTVRRLLKHEYSVELFMEGWRFFNSMRWYNNPNDPDRDAVLRSYVDKYKVQIEQTGLTGTVPFDYNKHLRLPIPTGELQTNPNMHGNSAN